MSTSPIADLLLYARTHTGFLTAAAPDDWNLVLEVCERASANENAAKEASRALRREFRYVIQFLAGRFDITAFINMLVSQYSLSLFCNLGTGSPRLN